METLCLLQDAIVIHEVYEEGAAARDGRLWAGDQILEVLTYSTDGFTVNTLTTTINTVITTAANTAGPTD